MDADSSPMTGDDMNGWIASMRSRPPWIAGLREGAQWPSEVKGEAVVRTQAPQAREDRQGRA